MIRDLRAIAGLAVIGIALLIALLRAPSPPPATRVVLPAFDPGSVRTLAWGEMLTLHLDGKWKGPTSLPVDQRYVADLLSSLRSARWHRKDAASHHAFARTLAIGGTKPIVLELGERLAGADQVWLRVDHGSDADLVDGWLAKLVDPEPIDPYERFPFETAGSEPAIALAGLHLQLRPWRDANGLVNPTLGEALVTALERVKLVALGRAAPAPASELELGSRRVLVGGACLGTELVAVQLEGTIACIDPAAWQQVTAAVTDLSRSVDATLDTRPAGFAIDHIDRGAGILSLAKRPTITVAGVTLPADPDLVTELLRALAEPSQPVAVPEGAPQLTLVITPVEGPPVVLDVFASAVHRRGEPRGITISSAQHDAIARPFALLRDPERWSEEASTITELALDGITYRRGAVLGEWTREPSGAPSDRFDPALVEILATAAAKLDAPASPGKVSPVHQLRIHFAPPVGAAVTRELTIGRVSSPGGSCAGLVASEAVSLPAELCAAVGAVAAR